MNRDMIPVPRDLLHRFTKWMGCMSYNDSYYSEPSGELKRTALEIEHTVNSHDRLVLESTQNSERELMTLVNRFLMWPLPKTVCSDGCVTNSAYQFPRSGTNLLNAEEAKEMIRYLLSDQEQRDPTSGQTLLTPVIEAKKAMADRGIPFAQFQEMFPKFLAAYDSVPVMMPKGQALAEKDQWCTGTPPTLNNDFNYYIVAVRRSHDVENVYVFPAAYANNYDGELLDQDGVAYIANGWYDDDTDDDGGVKFTPTLEKYDEVLAWQPMPKYHP